MAHANSNRNGIKEQPLWLLFFFATPIRYGEQPPIRNKTLRFHLFMRLHVRLQAADMQAQKQSHSFRVALFRIFDSSWEEQVPLTGGGFRGWVTQGRGIAAHRLGRFFAPLSLAPTRIKDSKQNLAVSFVYAPTCSSASSRHVDAKTKPL